MDIFGKIYALIDVEHGEALQERDTSWLAVGADAILAPTTAILRHEAVGIADAGAALALADTAAKSHRLPICEPALCLIAVPEQRIPQNEDIDPRIASSGCGISGDTDRGIVSLPGLDPGQASCLQLGNDRGGDVVVQAPTRRLVLIVHDNLLQTFLPFTAPARRRVAGGGRQEWTARRTEEGGLHSFRNRNEEKDPGLSGLQPPAAGLSGNDAHTPPP